MQEDTLAAYYADAAPEFELRYEAPDVQEDLDELQERVAELLDGHTVLELGCGTGYWTETLLYVAKSVHAIDRCPQMLERARARGLDPATVSFEQADAWALPDAPGRYTACFAGFLWSHLPREQQDKFLRQLRAKLGPDVLLVLIDDAFVEEETVIARTDLEGNTFQILEGASGQRYEVLKNFPAASNLRKRFAGHVRELRIEQLEHYWLLSGRLK